MSTAEKNVDELNAEPGSGRKFPLWIWIIIPILAITIMLVFFAFGNPLSLFTADLPPIEDLTIERIRVLEGGFEVSLVNGGPDPVTVAQVLVDDAYWSHEINPSSTIPRLGRATMEIPYPWVETEPHEIVVITSTGVTFPAEVPVAVVTPTPGLQEFLAYGLLGVYVGIIPVALGMLFFPAMKLMGRKWLGALLALTVGLLVFLLVDTLLEAFELSGNLPGVFQGIPLILFSALLTWLLILTISSQRKKSIGADPARQALYVATMIALGIGLHNLGEGLAIGVAFSIGEAALGSFLVIGFMLHNITEGVGIVAPLVPGKKESKTGNPSETSSEALAQASANTMKTPSLWIFAGLALLAGAPAILGTWIGGFAFSPLLAAVFLGIGVGAIWQVIVEVVGLLRRYAEREGTPLVSWINLGGLLVGIGIMYLTALLVKF
jgi:zinc transporter ZupT